MPTDMTATDVTLDTFRDAMAQLGAAVHVITTDGPGGRAGFTASTGFSKKGAMADRFAYGTWIERDGAPPHLADASASIDCRIVSRTQVGTHDILICEVIEITSNAHPGVLIYYDRKYHRVMRG
jgi:flavin reductase